MCIGANREEFCGGRASFHSSVSPWPGNRSTQTHTHTVIDGVQCASSDIVIVGQLCDQSSDPGARCVQMLELPKKRIAPTALVLQVVLVAKLCPGLQMMWAEAEVARQPHQAQG